VQQGGRGNRAAPVRAMQNAQPPQAGQQHGAALRYRGMDVQAANDVQEADPGGGSCR